MDMLAYFESYPGSRYHFYTILNIILVSIGTEYWYLKGVANKYRTMQNASISCILL